MRPQWPQGEPAFRSAVLDYYAACERLSLRLLSAIAFNLGANPEQLSRSFAPLHTSFLRLNYYPDRPRLVRKGSAGTGVPGATARNRYPGAQDRDTQVGSKQLPSWQRAQRTPLLPES